MSFCADVTPKEARVMLAKERNLTKQQAPENILDTPQGSVVC
jgi:hypothetical protein